MPELDGLEATRRIRSAERSTYPPRHIPIVALTANAISGDRERCIQAGMDGYQTKPLNVDKLIKCINTLVAEKNRPTATKRASAEAVSSVAGMVQTTAQPPFALDEVLDRCMGSAGTVLLVMDEFEKQLTVDLETISRAVASGDCEATKLTAHALKGASGMLSAASLENVAFKIEQLARGGLLDGTESLLPELTTEIERLLSYLPAARAELASRGSSKEIVAN